MQFSFLGCGKIGDMKKETTRPKKVTSPKAVKVKPSLVVAAGNQAFWVHNGPVLKSLVDLKNFLTTATLDQFFYHTKRGGNDFARWVRAILRDESAAAGLEKADTPKKAVAVVTKAIQNHKV